MCAEHLSHLNEYLHLHLHPPTHTYAQTPPVCYVQAKKAALKAALAKKNGSDGGEGLVGRADGGAGAGAGAGAEGEGGGEGGEEDLSSLTEQEKAKKLHPGYVNQPCDM